MAGLIATNSGRKTPRETSRLFLETLKRWLAILGETFQRGNALSPLQIKAYEVALSDMTPERLDEACAEVLRTWTFTAMPPPGVIRNAARAPVEPQFLGPPQLSYPDISQEEREAELESDEYQERRRKVFASQLRIVAQKTNIPKPTAADGTVIASPQRMKTLHEQAEQIRKKFPS